MFTWPQYVRQTPTPARKTVVPPFLVGVCVGSSIPSISGLHTGGVQGLNPGTGKTKTSSIINFLFMTLTCKP